MTQNTAIGIDVSKHELVCAVMQTDEKVLLTQAAPNSPDGHKELIRILKTYIGSRVVIEATSHYHYAVAIALREAGFTVCVVNPLITKRYALSGIRKTKTDKMDAKLLARVGLREHRIPVYAETPANIEKRRLVTLLANLKRQRSKLRQQQNQLKEIAANLNGFKIQLSALVKIETALTKQIERLEQELLKADPAKTKLASSIPGVGEMSAAAIVALLGDQQRFESKKQIVAFAGLDPSIRESGTSIQGRSRLSKRGSPVLRHTLFQAAWGLMMHNPEYKRYYEKKKAEGKHYYTILCAMARKLLILIYTLIKTQKPYVCQFESA